MSFSLFEVISREPEFDWSRDLRGLILSSVSYGYVSTQLFAGILAKKFGPKKVIAVGYSVLALCSLLTPLAATWSPYAMMVLQILQGMCGVCKFDPTSYSVVVWNCHCIPIVLCDWTFAVILVAFSPSTQKGAFFPCFWTMFGKWAPPLERSILIGFMMSGKFCNAANCSLSLWQTE